MIKKSLLNKTSKLFQILKKLSSSQLIQLRKLVLSPYFHQTEGVKDLFFYLRKFHPQYPSKKVSDTVIAQHLFPKAKNGEKKVKDFKSDLMKLIEQFLVLQQFSNQDSQQKILLAQAYQELQLPTYANSSIKKATQLLQKSTTKGLPFHHQKIQIAHYQYFHPDTLKVFKNQQKLQDLLDRLDHYFILAKYKYAHEAEERMAKQKEQFELKFWKEVQNEVSKSEDLEKQLPLYFYQQLHHLSTQNNADEKSFLDLKNHFLKHLKLLNQEDQQAIFKYLGNYITKALNSGATQFARLQLDFFKDGLSNNLVTWKNRITPNSFLNIIVVAATCNDFDWIEQFIVNYKNCLNPDHHEDVIKIARALIHFHQDQPEQVFAILSGAKFNAPNLELFWLPLEIKSIFELYLKDPSYYITIISRLDSLTKQVSKYGFAKKQGERYLNCVQFVKRLVKTSQQPDKNSSDIKNIRNQITSTQQLIHKSWLLKKCERMITSIS